MIFVTVSGVGSPSLSCFVTLKAIQLSVYDEVESRVGSFVPPTEPFRRKANIKHIIKHHIVSEIINERLSSHSPPDAVNLVVWIFQSGNDAPTIRVNSSIWYHGKSGIMWFDGNETIYVR